MEKLKNILNIVSRSSTLAMIQARKVGEKIIDTHPDLSVKYYTTNTEADIDSTIKISNPTDIGIFTRDISENILNEKYDLAIHSWKDLPIEPTEKTEIIGTLDRGDMRDILIVKQNLAIQKYKDCIEILTSSPRRKFNLENILPDITPINYRTLKFIDIRGNIETRLKKFINGDADMIVMAKVAIDRIIELGDNSSKKFIQSILYKNKWIILPLSIFPTAPGQGAIAIEARKDRFDLKEIINKINSVGDFLSVEKEKLILYSFGGGCHQKIGVSVWDSRDEKISSLVGETEKGELLHTLKSVNNKRIEKIKKIPKGLLYPTKYDRKIFSRKNINNIAAIEALKNSFIYISRKNVLDNCGNIHETNIIWSSGIECWKHATKKGIWVNGTSDSLGEENGINIENLIPQEYSFYKLSHRHTRSIRFTLIPTYELIFNEDLIKKTNLSKKSYFYWMSPLLFDKALEYFPEIINKNHSCGFGKTYDHLKSILPSSNKINCFFSYEDWLEFYQKGIA